MLIPSANASTRVKRVLIYAALVIVVTHLQSCARSTREARHYAPSDSPPPTVHSNASPIQNIRISSLEVRVDSAVKEAIQALSKRSFNPEQFDLTAKRVEEGWEVTFNVRARARTNELELVSGAMELRKLRLGEDQPTSVGAKPLHVEAAIAAAIDCLTKHAQMPKNFDLATECIGNIWYIEFDSTSRKLHSDRTVIVYSDGKALELLTAGM